MKLQILITIFSIFFLFGCNNEIETRTSLPDGSKINVDISVNPPSEKFLIDLAYNQIIKDSLKLFPKFYWALLKDTSNVHYFEKCESKHIKSNMEAFSYTVSLRPHQENRSKLIYKLFNDSLFRLNDFQLLAKYNESKNEFTYGMKLSFSDYDKIKKKEFIYNSFETYDTIYNPFKVLKVINLSIADSLREN